MNVVQDTTIVSQFTKPQPDAAALAWLQRTSPRSMYLSVISIFEVRLGVEKMSQGAKRNSISAWLEFDLPARYLNRILPVTPAIADDAGRLSARCQRAGFNVEPQDVLIAATARVHGYSVATLNRKHFKVLDVPLVDF